MNRETCGENESVELKSKIRAVTWRVLFKRWMSMRLELENL